MNYWKIGSRWSEDGNSGSSILEVFKKNNVVFSGSKTDVIMRDVKQGDFIAISDGIYISCIAKALEDPKPVTELDIRVEDRDKFEYADWVKGVKVHIVDLDQKIRYRIGAFHRLNEHREELKKIYEGENRQFEINAKTCTISSDVGNRLLDEKLKYVIPIYQRPYSWGEAQIDKFIADIFASYSDKEPVFFGTMQFGPKELIDQDNDRYIQQVIDGQQRLTTILVFLKVLSLKYKDELGENFNIYFNNFETEVNNETQETYRKAFFTIDSFQNLIDRKEEKTNQYIQNAILISEKLEAYLTDSLKDDEDYVFDVTDFLTNHFFKNLFFVVIETRAGLSKTLQIFNTINTTGLDLQGTDIFKIRFYEYLKDIEHKNKEVFADINKVYEKVDKLREKKIPTNMSEILSIYQVYLIGKFNLNTTLYGLNVNTFFERFFDQLLRINSYDNFKNITTETVKLSLEDLEIIISVREQFKNDSHKGLELCELHMINTSRYGRYRLWLFIFYLRYRNDVDFKEKKREFIAKLSKLLNVYSVFYAKAINEIHIFMRDLNRKMLENADSLEILEILSNKLQTTADRFESEFSKGIAGNGKWKYIICRTSAILDDLEDEDLFKKYFVDHKIDIEHIQCFTDQVDPQMVRETWGETLNSIGNLIVLEAGSNKGIKNDSSKKDEVYSKSNFAIVRKLRGDKFIPAQWTKEKAEERKREEIEKLKKYYYGN